MVVIRLIGSISDIQMDLSATVYH